MRALLGVRLHVADCNFKTLLEVGMVKKALYKYTHLLRFIFIIPFFKSFSSGLFFLLKYLY